MASEFTTTRTELSVQDFVDKAIAASRKDYMIDNVVIGTDNEAHTLQEELVKVDLQMSKIETKAPKIYLKPLDEFCNCLRLDGYDSNNYICKFHKAFQQLGPQYWIDGDRIKYDHGHPVVKDLVLFSGCEASSPNTTEREAMLINQYGSSGNVNRENLKRQFRFKKLHTTRLE